IHKDRTAKAPGELTPGASPQGPQLRAALARLSGLEAAFGLFPVDHVPPGVHVLQTCVLVVEIVGVLPEVETDDRQPALHQGRVPVRRRLDAQRAVGGGDEPGPARAEERSWGRDAPPLLLHRLEGAEGGVDGVGEVSGRLAAAVGAHGLLVYVRLQRVVVVREWRKLEGHGSLLSSLAYRRNIPQKALLLTFFTRYPIKFLGGASGWSLL